MLKIKLIIIILFSYSSLIKAQNFIEIGDKQLIASDSFVFELSNKDFSYNCQNYSSGSSYSSESNAIMSFAKDEQEKIILSIKVQSYNCSCCKFKNIILYLENGKTIAIQNPFYQEKVDNSIIGFYYLTTDDVNTMKKYYIRKIKYSVVGTEQPNSAEPALTMEMVYDNSELKMARIRKYVSANILKNFTNK